MLVQVDGEEDVKDGATLHEFAQLMQILGAKNAVNVDGGGSSVSVWKGKVIDKPSCNDTPEVCVRPVTTIFCIK